MCNQQILERSIWIIPFRQNEKIKCRSRLIKATSAIPTAITRMNLVNSKINNQINIPLFPGGTYFSHRTDAPQVKHNQHVAGNLLLHTTSSHNKFVHQLIVQNKCFYSITKIVCCLSSMSVCVRGNALAF